MEKLSVLGTGEVLTQLSVIAYDFGNVALNLLPYQGRDWRGPNAEELENSVTGLLEIPAQVFVEDG